MENKKLITIVTPVYNEEDNIDFYYQKMTQTLNQISDYNFEILFTDNCSTDNTFNKLEQLAKRDSRIRILRFSKNFGYQASIYTGYCHANGDAVIEFDCDLQDPPELLPEFLSKWEDGKKIIYGIRKKRAEGPFITLLRKIYYRLLNKISDVELPVDVGDFMLLDRVIIEHLKNSHEKNLYLRGMVFGLGYPSVGIPYERHSRQHGTSKFPFSKMAGLALRGVISQSITPLRIASYIAILITFFTAVLSLVYLYMKFFTNANMPDGFTTISLLILLSMALNAFFLGVIGEYIARIFEQVRGKPVTIIEKKLP